MGHRKVYLLLATLRLYSHVVAGGRMILRLNISDTRNNSIFRYRDMRDILLVAMRAPDKEFTVSDIARQIGTPPNTGNLRLSVKALVNAGLLLERKAGRGSFHRINPDAMIISENPYALIPQAEYRPIMMKILEQLKVIRGIERVILFGSVARGNADRLSDIDILVVSKTPLKVSDRASGLIREARTGELLGDRYNLNVKVLEPEEINAPRGFVKDALIEGIEFKR